MGSERVQPVAALKDIDLDALEPALVEELRLGWLAAAPSAPGRASALDGQAGCLLLHGVRTHESLPIYSGGLGMLAGDHLRSALGIDLVAVGLMYRSPGASGTTSASRSPTARPATSPPHAS